MFAHSSIPDASPRSHRTTRRRLGLVGIGLAFTFALTACGGGAAENGTPGDDSVVDQEAQALVPEELRNAGVLTVGTFAPSPPTRMFEEDGKTLTGLDITMSEEIGKALGLDVQFQNMKWDGLLPALRSGRFDMVAAQMGDYEERRENGDFVDYYTHGASAVALESSAGDYEDEWALCGKRIGYQSGVAAAQELPKMSDQCATENPEAGPMQLNPFPDDAAGLLAVRSGQSDAHVLDNTAAAYQVQQSQAGEKLQIVADDLVERGNIGLVISKDQPELRDAVTLALENMHESGRYQEILDQYGLGDYGVKEITVNTTVAVK